MDLLLEFGDSASEILSVGCKQRIKIANNKPVGCCKVTHKVMVDKNETYHSFNQMNYMRPNVQIENALVVCCWNFVFHFLLTALIYINNYFTVDDIGPD